VKEEKKKEAVERVIKVMAVEEVKMKKNMRDCREGSEREMIGITVGSEGKRKEILSKKNNLKGRRERITKDWKERKMR